MVFIDQKEKYIVKEDDDILKKIRRIKKMGEEDKNKNDVIDEELEKKIRLMEEEKRIKLEKEEERQRIREEARRKKEEKIMKKREAKERKKAEKRRRDIERKERESREKTARELEIEPVVPEELKVKKLPKEDEIKLIPSPKVAKVMVKEAGLGLKEGLQKVKKRIKKEAYMTPRKTSTILARGLKRSAEKTEGFIKAKLKEREAYEKALKRIRRKERLSAQASIIRRQERQRVGLPVFTQKKSSGFEKRVKTNIPLFTPKKMGESAPIFNMERKGGLNIFEYKKKRKKK